MTELTERLLVAVAAIINDIRAMQAGEADSEKDWFEGFSTWEYDEDVSVSVEWPNLAVSVDNLDQAIKEIYSNRQDKLTAEIARLEIDMVNAGRKEKIEKPLEEKQE